MEEYYHFNRIVIVQSLGKDEFHTGKKLNDDLEILNQAHDLGLDIELHDVETKKELLDLLSRLTKEARQIESFPILHLEIHGSNDKKGLVLASGEFVGWQELKNPLVNLNIVTKNNLFIVLAVCHGAYLLELFLPTDRSPCWGMIGPESQISAGNLLQSYSVFYEELLKTGDGNKAVKLLNGKVQKEGTDYYFTTAERHFIQVFKMYSNNPDLCSPKALRERARKVRKEIKKSKSEVVPSVGALIRQFNKKSIQFDEYKQRFLMLDMYPENKERFTIEYADIRDE